MQDGSINGSFENDYFIGGVFDSSTEGTFTGSLINNELTADFSGQVSLVIPAQLLEASLR